jgi:hypothetical protein
MNSNRKKIAEINCEEAARRFNDFIDNYLKGIAREELTHHIENCKHCFDRMEFELLLKNKIASLAKVTEPASYEVKNKIDTILSKLNKR